MSEDALQAATKPSAPALAAARELARTFGAVPRIDTFTATAGDRSVDLAVCVDRPAGGITSVGTTTLSDHPLGFAPDQRIEIVAAFPNGAEAMLQVLGRCALSVMTLGWPMRWGAVHEHMLTPYGLSSTLAHILFVPPLLWPNGPSAFEVDGRRVAWLMAVPIAESERAFAEREGVPALEKRFGEAGIDVCDLDRPAVV